MGPEGRGRRKLCRRRGRASRAWYPCWPLPHGHPAAGRGKAGGDQGAAGTEQEAGCPDGGGQLGRAGGEAVRVSPGGLSTLPRALCGPCPQRLTGTLAGFGTEAPSGLGRPLHPGCCWFPSGDLRHLPVSRDPCLCRVSVFLLGEGIAGHNGKRCLCNQPPTKTLGTECLLGIPGGHHLTRVVTGHCWGGLRVSCVTA